MKTIVKLIGVVMLVAGVATFTDNWMAGSALIVLGLAFAII